MFDWIFQKPHKYIISLLLLILALALQTQTGHFGNCVFTVLIIFSSLFLGKKSVFLILIPASLTAWQGAEHFGTRALIFKELLLIATMSVAVITGVSLKNKVTRESRLNKEVIYALINAIDARDKYLSGHSLNVAFYASKIAECLKVERKTKLDVYIASLLHDVGKIGISEVVLAKPTPLSDEEWQLIKKHPSIGADIVRDIDTYAHLAPFIKYHHQHYDGGGYPDAIKGEEIPLVARVITVADAFDAMTSDRVYRARKTVEEALKEINRCAGTQFDPKIAKVFLNYVKQNPDILDAAKKFTAEHKRFAVGAV